MKSRTPVILQNPVPTRPFESLVKLLALPRYGHIDPTQLMAFFLPIFFGMILGDVGYGLVAFAVCLGLMRRFKSGVMRDLLIVIAMGTGWAIVFGFLYGEVFGTLGEHLGMHPLWFSRTSSEHVLDLLIMAVVVGAVHISLGLILGVWEAIKDRSRSHLLERGGMLVGLIGLFMIVSILTHLLPDGFMNVAIAVTIVGIVLLSVSLGYLGIVMGSIEFVIRCLQEAEVILIESVRFVIRQSHKSQYLVMDHDGHAEPGWTEYPRTLLYKFWREIGATGNLFVQCARQERLTRGDNFRCQPRP